MLGAPILGFLGEAYLLVGRPDEASTVATRTLHLVTERGERGWRAWAHRLLGELAASRDHAESAEEAYRQALELADELGMRPLVAQCQLGLGRLYRRTGKRLQAAEHLTAASTMFSDMGMAWWLDQAEGARISRSHS